MSDTLGMAPQPRLEKALARWKFAPQNAPFVGKIRARQRRNRVKNHRLTDNEENGSTRNESERGAAATVVSQSAKALYIPLPLCRGLML
jgi:hypothetical protein